MKLKFKELPIKGYEKVVFITEPESGLEAIIALHDTTLGPALGGTRILPYPSVDAALEDVLRLAEGMTYKSAIAEVGLGGGKGVIIADQKKKTPALLHAYGKAIERFHGLFITAEDVGCHLNDCMAIRETTRYVTGLPHAKSSGNPAPFTAWGVFRGIQATAQALFGSDSLRGKTIAIQGLGAVGSELIHHLFWAGAHLIVADMMPEKTDYYHTKYGVEVVPCNEILFQACDILAPCALGTILNADTISKLRCKAVAGAANNQLKHSADADLLKERGILYAPDFVINAGGLINVSQELVEKGYHPMHARKDIDKIFDVLLSIFDIARKNHTSTHQAAITLADYRLEYGIGKRRIAPHFPEMADSVYSNP